MIPLQDLNPTRSIPIVTVLLIAACSAIYLFVQPHDRGVQEARFSFENAAIPCEVVRQRPLSQEEVVDTVRGGDATACETRPSTPPAFPGKNVLLAVLYSMFLHGGIVHLGGNMLYLWVFGNNIEDRMGVAAYLAFYLLAGLVATIAHVLVEPSSTVPLVGASGAIAGVMGTYLVLHPNVRIRSLIIFFFIMFREIPAKWLLGIWFVSQFFIQAGEGVAWMAHVGGFVFGVIVGLGLRAISGPEEPAPAWSFD